MAWVSASIPLAAVRRGGRLLVLRGSNTATSGRNWSETISCLRRLRSSCTTATPVHSEPVPEVVGTITNGTGCPRVSHSLPSMARSVLSPCESSARTALAVSSTEPPPMARTPSQPSSRARFATLSTSEKEESLGMSLWITASSFPPILSMMPSSSRVRLTSASGFLTPRRSSS